jgi:hypothetical protein
MSLKVDPVPAALDPSKTFKVAHICADLVTTRKGSPEEVATALRELRAVIEGVEPLPRQVRELTLAAGLVVLVLAAAQAGTFETELVRWYLRGGWLGLRRSSTMRLGSLQRRWQPPGRESFVHWAGVSKRMGPTRRRSRDDGLTGLGPG